MIQVNQTPPLEDQSLDHVLKNNIFVKEDLPQIHSPKNDSDFSDMGNFPLLSRKRGVEYPMLSQNDHFRSNNDAIEDFYKT